MPGSGGAEVLQGKGPVRPGQDADEIRTISCEDIVDIVAGSYDALSPCSSCAPCEPANDIARLFIVKGLYPAT